jgi:hypothetical protein
MQPYGRHDWVIVTPIRLPKDAPARLLKACSNQAWTLQWNTSGRSAVGSAPRSGRGGRWFKSSRPDHTQPQLASGVAVLGIDGWLQRLEAVA